MQYLCVWITFPLVMIAGIVKNLIQKTRMLQVLQYHSDPHRNDAAVRVSVFDLHISQVKNSSQNLKQPHLIGLIDTWSKKKHFS